MQVANTLPAKCKHRRKIFNWIEKYLLYQIRKPPTYEDMFNPIWTKYQHKQIENVKKLVLIPGETQYSLQDLSKRNIVTNLNELSLQEKHNIQQPSKIWDCEIEDKETVWAANSISMIFFLWLCSFIDHDHLPSLSWH